MENRSPFVLNLRVNCGVVAIERLSGKWCVFRFISSFFHLWAAATLGLCWFSPFSKNVLLSNCRYITAKTWLSSCVIVILMILIMIMMTSDPGHHDDQHHLQLEILQKLFHKDHIPFFDCSKKRKMSILVAIFQTGSSHYLLTRNSFKKRRSTFHLYTKFQK